MLLIQVTHVLAGEDAGPAKIAKAEELGIKILNEDEFLKIIEKSNKTKAKSESHKAKKDNNHDKKSHIHKLVNGTNSKDEIKKIELEKEKSASETISIDEVDKSEIKKEKSDTMNSDHVKISKSKLEVNNKNDKKKNFTENIGVVKLETDSKSESVSSSSSSINLANSEFRHLKATYSSVLTEEAV